MVDALASLGVVALADAVLEEFADRTEFLLLEAEQGLGFPEGFLERVDRLEVEQQGPDALAALVFLAGATEVIQPLQVGCAATLPIEENERAHLGAC